MPFVKIAVIRFTVAGNNTERPAAYFLRLDQDNSDFQYSLF